MLRPMSFARKSTAAAAALLCLSTALGCGSSSSHPDTRGLARTCGNVTLLGHTLLIEIVDGKATCAGARSVLKHARVTKHAGPRGWLCGSDTPAYGFTSLVVGCDGRSSALQAVPVEELSRIGAACRRFAGPGDDLLHGVDFRVHGISCANGKRVVETCHVGKRCPVGASTWICTRPKQKVALGYGERCVSGSRFTSIVWLD
jgi:hypothetical protein